MSGLWSSMVCRCDCLDKAFNDIFEPLLEPAPICPALILVLVPGNKSLGISLVLSVGERLCWIIVSAWHLDASKQPSSKKKYSDPAQSSRSCLFDETDD